MPKQSVNQVTVKTGGKLYIAGEYSVLTAGQTSPNPIYSYFHVSRCQGSTNYPVVLRHV